MCKIEQANQRATEAEAEARTAVEQVQHGGAEMRGRADQLATENARLTKLIEEQLSKLTDDPQEPPLTPKENQQKHKISSTLREYDATQ